MSFFIWLYKDKHYFCNYQIFYGFFLFFSNHNPNPLFLSYLKEIPYTSVRMYEQIVVFIAGIAGFEPTWLKWQFNLFPM